MNNPTLNPLHFPFNHHALIEASAGTGKTWTIAALYVRIILEKNFTPQQILVLTFTQAATAELKSRIRSRLEEAARAFEGETADPFLTQLVQKPYNCSLQACAQKLRLAAQMMDEARIHTIHAWCFSVLKSAAIFARMPFQCTLINDEQKQQLKYDAACAYWREFYTPLTAEELKIIFQFWEEPKTLLHNIENLLKNAQFIPTSLQFIPKTIIQNYQSENKKIELEIKENLPLINNLKYFLIEAKENKKFNGVKFKSTTFNQCMSELNNLENNSHPKNLTKCFEKLNLNFLQSVWKNQTEDFSTVPALTLFEKWKTDYHQANINLQKEIYQHAACCIRNKIQFHYTKENILDFDSLLLKCVDSLNNNPAMIDYLRKQFPIALIDEFQDTDPNQCIIFEKIYLTSPNQNILILIGDPKQAIYAFRGADVYSYLTIRQKLNHVIQTLKTNFRSSHEMVSAVNLLFKNAENNLSQGAFGFKTTHQNDLPFIEVNSAQKNECVKCNQHPIPSLSCFYLDSNPELNTAEKRRKTLAENCANELANMLNQSLYFEDQITKKQHSFSPEDCAILVNNNQEAQIIKKALQKSGIPCAYLSERESVYKQTIARELFIVLDSILNRKEENIYAALLTKILNKDYQEILKLQQDEDALESILNQFKNYADYWQNNGVQALIHKILFDFHTIEKCQNIKDGNRILTDIRHLAELLQQENIQLNSQNALLEYFNYRINAIDLNIQAEEEQIVRLETDEPVVQIITIHKSKGLEYPVVFIPFLSQTYRQKKQNYPLFYHDENHQFQTKIHWSQDEEINRKINNEILFENTRKIYVAFTRARHVLWLGFDSFENKNETLSAFGRLIHAFSGENTKDSFYQWIQLLNKNGHTNAVLKECSLHPQTITYHPKKYPSEKKQPLLKIENYQHDNYIISSFSNLTHHLNQYAFNIKTKQESENSYDLIKELTVLKNFDKGTNFGNQIHKIFENLVQNQCSVFNVKNNHSAFSFLNNFEQINDYKEWFEILCSNPLPIAEKLALKELNSKQILSEMEFYFPIQNFDIKKLDDLTQKHIFPQYQRENIQKENLNGMLKGYIDLTFSVNHRYYILDYKTNFLGEYTRDYSLENIKKSFLEHRYDLQMSIYLIALHKFLKIHCPNYSPEKNIGGVIYYYLRGAENKETKGFIFWEHAALFLSDFDKLFEK